MRSKRSVFQSTTILTAGAVLALALTGASGVAAATALDDYVAAADANYAYGPTPANTIVETGYTAYVWEMASQVWRDGTEVDRTLWEHYLIIIVPDTVSHTDTCLLFIGGGNNSSGVPTSVDASMAMIAVDTQSIVAELRMIPNQALKFPDETDPRYIDDGRTEDELIAYCWDKYKITGDAEWLPRLPMTKAVVRAMDTIQAEHALVTDFVVAGGSKRGWTTWTTAAVDSRVVGIIPMVIDLLNVENSFRHHWDCYGYWADAVGDYVDMDVMSWMHTPTFRDMMAIVDPYYYLDRLTMPKMVMNATGDQFFLPDSSQYYTDALQGESYLRYVPNTDHGLDTEAVMNFEAFYNAILDGVARPEFDWTLEADGSIRVETVTAPTEVRLWQATNTTDRNFRLDTIGAAWTSSVLTDQGGGVYVGSVSEPAQGWTAFFVELTFPSGGLYPFKFTTDVRVNPDTAPYRDVGGWGTIETVGTGDDAISVVKLGGDRYQMGYWYGMLLADQIAPCWAGLKAALGATDEQYDAAIAAMWKNDYFDTVAWELELRGMADGCLDAGYPEVTYRELQKMLMVADLSEVSCGLFAIWGAATADNHLYQMRNLDWAMDTGAQDYPVVAVYYPDDGERHATIGFAGPTGGAIGGMNIHGIAISEIMGGFNDTETLDGVPYPVLLRDALYHDTTLAEALTRVQNATRTCEYYYCLSGPDGGGDPDARLLFTSNTRFDQYGGGEAITHPYYSPFYTPLTDVVYWKRHDGGAYAMPGAEDDRKGNQTLYAAIDARYGTIEAAEAIEIAVADGVDGTVVSIVYDTTAGISYVAFAEGATTPAQNRSYVEVTMFDADGDGIGDAIEGTVDSDIDGTPDYLDTDSDDDGIDDSIEGVNDVDGDTIPNYLDLDSDDDDYLDADEWGVSDPYDPYDPDMPTITLTSPTGGETAEAGRALNITWTSTGYVPDVRIRLVKGGVAQDFLARDTADDGHLLWNIPAGLTPGTDYSVRIFTYTGTVYISDESAAFTIGEPKSITVTSPNGGNTLDAGRSAVITWDSAGAVGPVNIRLLKGGVAQDFVVKNTANDGSVLWNVPAGLTPGSDYRLRIFHYDGSRYVWDDSDADFTIAEERTITITSPNGGQSWQRGNTYEITWNSTGAVGPVRIRLFKGGVPQAFIVKDTNNDGSYWWNLSGSLVGDTDYTVRIFHWDGVKFVYDDSDGPFTITE